MTGEITLKSKQYPFLLKQIPTPPEVLYYKGSLDHGIFDNCVGIVGSRKVTQYGSAVIKNFVPEISRAGITVVSGFMNGVDALAHRVALESGGNTIAVMPCGIERVHPSYQKDLYDEILKSDGLILSEYGGRERTARWTYPMRNRIIAGVSLAVLVVEAAVQSGSLITACFAKDYKRKLFAVPGSIFSETSVGTNKLVEDGAEAVFNATQIIDFFNKNCLLKGLEIPLKTAKPLVKRLQELSAEEFRLYNKIRDVPVGVNSLAKSLRVSVVELNVLLSKLQLEDLIYENEGVWHAN